MRDHNIIDLKSNTLEIKTYKADLIAAHLEILGLKRPLDLDLFEYNCKVFKTDAAAERWRALYIDTRTYLIKNAKSAKLLPKLLTKRRYIVLAALGEKMSTNRKYALPWEKGTLFQLYDQSIFLTVKLTKLTDNLDGTYTYEYKVA